MASDKKMNPVQSVPLPADPGQAVTRLIEMIDAMAAIFTVETEALNQGDTKAFQLLHDRKLAATRAYQDAFAQVLDRDDIKGRVAPHLLQELQARQSTFDGISRANCAALERINRSTTRLHDRIMGMFRDSAKRKAHAYGSRGVMQDSNRSVSVSINASA